MIMPFQKRTVFFDGFGKVLFTLKEVATRKDHINILKIERIFWVFPYFLKLAFSGWHVCSLSISSLIVAKICNLKAKSRQQKVSRQQVKGCHPT
jgi:hypothetical protein